MSDVAAYAAPRWLRDLMRFLSLKSQFVISGNVRDLQLHATPSGPIPQPLVQHLVSRLRDHGYASVVTYDPASGFRLATLPGETADDADTLLTQLGLQPSNGRAPAGIDLFAVTMERIVHWPAEPIALIVDFASRLVVRQDSLSAQEHQVFSRALILSHQAAHGLLGTHAAPFSTRSSGSSIKKVICLTGCSLTILASGIFLYQTRSPCSTCACQPLHRHARRGAGCSR